MIGGSTEWADWCTTCFADVTAVGLRQGSADTWVRYLTQVSADPWRNPTAVTSAKQVVHQSAHSVEPPIMGWGVDNPEPSPGHYDWKSLDSRMQFIASTGAVPVITLAGAPDWMK